MAWTRLATPAVVHNGLMLGPGASNLPAVYEPINLTQDTLGNPTGLVGVNLVLLRVTLNAVGSYARSIDVKPQGLGYDGRATTSNNMGCTTVYNDEMVPRLVLSFTSAAGFVDVWCSHTDARTIELIGYANASLDNTLIGSGVMPVVHTEVDLSAHISEESLAIMQYQYVVGQNADDMSGRYIGDLEESNSPNAYDGANRNRMAAYGIFYPDRSFCVPVNASGKFEHRNENAGADRNWILIGHTEARHHGSAFVNVYSGTPTGGNVYDTLNTGLTEEALCCLRVKKQAGGLTQEKYTFRPGDDPVDYVPQTFPYTYSTGPCTCRITRDHTSYVIVPCDSAGDIDFACEDATPDAIDIDIISYAPPNYPPVITPTGPIGTGTPGDDISFTCSDDIQVDSATIQLELEDPDLNTIDVIINGVFQAGYSGTITANASNGFDVAVTGHPLMDLGVWSATATVDDTLGETDSDSWGWTVSADAPALQDSGPTGTTTELTRIYAQVTDDWGIDTSTIELSAVPPVGAPLVAITGGVIQAGWTGSIIELDDIGDGPREILIELSGWPELRAGQLWRFDLDLTSVTGLTL